MAQAKLPKYEVLIKAPINGRVGKASFRFRFLGGEKDGKIAHADKADIESEPDRSRLIRRAAKKLKVPEARLRRQVEQECNRFLDDALHRQEQEAAGAPPGDEAPAAAEQLSAAALLIRLADQASVELMHQADGKTFARVLVGDHREVWPLREAGCRRWLRRLYYLSTSKPPGAQAVEDALAVLEARAAYDGPECSVEVRLAELGACTYLDLADARWQAVEVSAHGWCVTADAPARFRRPKGVLALPAPAPGGRLDELRRFVNLEPDNKGATDREYRLLVAWLLATLRPRGPYPVLCLYGQQGSAKSTTARVLRQLIDPNAAPLRTEPKEARDLMVAAGNSWCLCYDNLSTIPGWLSDALCGLATGGGFSTRQLYSDGEETLFSAMRPVILTSIEDVATRGDLLDRALLLNLPPIPETARRTERDFWADFERARPRLLGALLDAAVAVARLLPGIRLPCLPRMADFALVGVAAERALGWPDGSFLAAYGDNRAGANVSALEASPVAAALRRFMEKRCQWSGTAGELLPELTALVDPKTAEHRDWPRRANTLSGRLKRLAPNLAAVGLEVEFSRDMRARSITLKNGGGEASSSSSCASSPDPETLFHDDHDDHDDQSRARSEPAPGEEGYSAFPQGP